jgi:tetratricopeptide (TPR) repeat protein
MAYQEEKQVRLRRQVSRQAISLAMEGRWQESITVNKSLIESYPNDVDAYNRLGKAYMELGDYVQAKEAYGQAVKLDQYNSIAKKNLERIAHLSQIKAETRVITAPTKAEPHLFIEEIGKAAVINLYQIAPAPVLIKMMAGDKVNLKSQESNLAVENSLGEVLGLVPTRHATRLIKLLAGGNQYAAAIVSASENAVSVIIRETFQSPGQVGQLSFPSRRHQEVQPFISDRVFSKEFEDEEGLSEASAFAVEEEGEMAEELVEDIGEDKEKTWEQEA